MHADDCFAFRSFMGLLTALRYVVFYFNTHTYLERVSSYSFRRIYSDYFARSVLSPLCWKSLCIAVADPEGKYFFHRFRDSVHLRKYGCKRTWEVVCGRDCFWYAHGDAEQCETRRVGGLGAHFREAFSVTALTVPGVWIARGWRGWGKVLSAKVKNIGKI